MADKPIILNLDNVNLDNVNLDIIDVNTLFKFNNKLNEYKEYNIEETVSWWWKAII